MEKRNNIIYWAATGLLSFGMLASGVSQVLRQKEMVELMAHVGYPSYFMTVIGVWKILGVMALLVPNAKLLKEWAYAGFFFLMTGALISHLAVGDTGKAILGPAFQTGFVILSWHFRPANRKYSAQ